MGPTDKNIWDRPIPVPKSTIEYVDEAIRRGIPFDFSVRTGKRS